MEKFVPINELGGYNIAIRIDRMGNDFKSFLTDSEGGSKYDLFDFQTLMGRDARLGFPYWVGNLKVVKGSEQDEVVFIMNGVRMKFGELVEFMTKKTDFKLV